MPREHTSLYRVSYADTDRMNRVYYANYLAICERARTEFLRDLGHPYRALEEADRFFPVRSCHVRYRGYAVYDDLLLCRTRVTRLRHATVTFATDIYRDGSPSSPLVNATVELACVTPDGRPRVIPEEVRGALEAYVEEKGEEEKEEEEGRPA